MNDHTKIFVSIPRYALLTALCALMACGGQDVRSRDTKPEFGEPCVDCLTKCTPRSAPNDGEDEGDGGGGSDGDSGERDSDGDGERELCESLPFTGGGEGGALFGGGLVAGCGGGGGLDGDGGGSGIDIPVMDGEGELPDLGLQGPPFTPESLGIQDETGMEFDDFDLDLDVDVSDIEVLAPSFDPTDVDGRCCIDDPAFCPDGVNEECPFICGDGIVTPVLEACDGNCEEPEDCGEPPMCTMNEYLDFGPCWRGCGIVDVGCIQAVEDGCCDLLLCDASSDADCAVALVGTPCQSDDDCGGLDEAGATCLDFEDGYCTAGCGIFSGNVECPTGSHCIDQLAATSLADQCATTCTSDTDCRENGYTCTDVPFLTFENGETRYITDGIKECVPAATGMGVIGDACTKDSDCAGGVDGLCRTHGPGGDTATCTLRCGMAQVDIPGAPVLPVCPEGSACDLMGGASGVCQPTCDGDGDCPTGQRCSGFSRFCVP